MILKIKGFTLIELLVVVTIIGVLSVVGIPKLLQAINRAKLSTAKSDIANLNKSLGLYSVEVSTGRFPIYPAESKIKTSLSVISPTFMESLPKGPYETDNDEGYAYKYISSSGLDYTLSVMLKDDKRIFTLIYSSNNNMFNED